MHFKYEMFVSNYAGNYWVSNPKYILDANYYKCDDNDYASDVSSLGI